MLALPHVLPRPGPVWGAYPLRPGEDRAGPWRGVSLHGAWAGCAQTARHSRRHAAAWQAMPDGARPAAVQALRAALRRHGLQGDVLAQALGLAAACAEQCLGLAARAAQLQASAALLLGHMAEMATGEGKTLSIAMAAAVAALAGIPVHVVTANDYLAARDRQGMQPLFDVLDISVATLSGLQGEAARRAAYGHDVVYATAKDLAFDFLRDREAGLAGRSGSPLPTTPDTGTGAAPLLRGLCMALLDEADSILMDEADIPLILSRAAPQAARRAFLWQALALARQLQEGEDFQVQAHALSVQLTALGEQRLAERADGLGGPWRRARYRREAVATALSGLHATRRNVHYLVRDGAVVLLDEVTGRAAEGRVWSRGLHTVVALKEGLAPPEETETLAQTSFQRFFQRYWRLCGISGTLREARSELRAVYGARVVRIPLHHPDRRSTLPSRRFAGRDAMFDAVPARLQELLAAGRPVLVATDDVGDSLALSQRLEHRGIAHAVLNALQDAEEARIIAQAGIAGRVTVATRMAGRGTDIAPDAAALAAGGLHVLSLQHNPSRRLDRQLAGRTARHGDPGSVECWSRDDFRGPGAAPAMLPCGAAKAWAQWSEENRRAALRAHLMAQDLEWEKRLSFAGAPG